MDIDFDVIVVGAGGAGLSAALAAAGEGAKVMVVEAGRRVGGSTAYSGGVIYAGGTSVQKKGGVIDTPRAMYDYYMVMNQYRLNPALIHRLCHEAPSMIDWLTSLGVTFPHSYLYAAGLDGVLRGHRAEGRGEAIVEVLDSHASGHDNVEIVLNTRVEDLIVRNGEVAGVVAGGVEVGARTVVLTTGGFGANLEMISRYLPGTARYGDWLWYVGSPLSRGDGISLGLKVGAEVTGLDTVAPLLTPGFGRDFEPHVPGWFMFVSHDGRRFANETLDYSVSGAIVRDLPAGECFAIFDETARTGQEVKLAKGGAVYASPSWAPDRLGALAEAGKIARCSSLAELADKVGLNGPTFEVTVATYNRHCERGEDGEFFKDAALLRPILDPPFYAVRIRPAVVGITGAGLRVDRDLKVLDASGKPIKGLYAAGETVGGLMGNGYIGGGGALAHVLTFGRAAGEAAALQARRNGI